MNAKIQCDEISSCERKVTVKIPVEVIQEEINQYFNTLALQSKLKGFRPGKAPVEVIKMQFKGQVVNDVISHLIEKTYAQAIQENNLFVVSEPKIESSSFQEGKPFEYTATLEVKPNIEIKNYEGFSLEKKTKVVDQKRIEDVLKQLQESKAQLKTVLEIRPIKNKDFVVMDFEGLVDGKSFPGGSSQNFLYEMGSHRFVGDFEKGILGMKTGENKDIQVTFPSDFHEKKLADKDVLFKVVIREIKEKEIPELNEAFLKEFEGCQNIEELKAKIKEDLTKYDENETKNELETQVTQKVVDTFPLTVPPSMVKRQYEFLIEDAKKRFHQMGLQQKELIDEQLKKMENHLKEKAEFDVKAILLLESIAKKEKIEVTEEQLNEFLENIAKSANTSQATVKNYYTENGILPQIKWRLLQEKTLQHLVSKAKIKEK